MSLPSEPPSSRDVLVLCYHAVSPTWTAPFSIQPARLEGQLRTLLARGYRATTFTDAVTRPATGRTLAVTFDDAYRSVFKLGRPVLRELDVPATVFVPTAYAGSEEPMSWSGIEHWIGSEYERELVPMGWDELGTLADEGWEIGSHTHNHRRLPELDAVTLHEELSRSRAECETRLGIACTSIAYPFGDHSPAVVAAIGRAGYTAAGAVSGRVREPGPLLWPRDGIYRSDHSLAFRLKVSRGARRLRTSRAWRARFLLRRLRAVGHR